jgi:hypothetical protein
MVWATSISRSVAGLLATLLQDETSSSGLDDVKTVADIIGTLVTALALLIGAVWAYYRFVKGRTFRPRLEVSMGGEWLTVHGKRLLLARVRVKDIGASVVRLRQEGTGLRVSSPVDSDAPGAVGWEPGHVYTILEKHEWIEPGETVSDDVLLHLAVTEGQPVLFETRLVWNRSGLRWKKRNIVVFARQVVPPGADLPWATQPFEENEVQAQTAAGQVAKARSVMQVLEELAVAEPQRYRPETGSTIGQAYEDPHETEAWERAVAKGGETGARG